jgi:hypothetical protein
LKQIKFGHISQLGISPELFEVMAQNAESDPARVKLNKKKIRREIKKRKRAKVKGLRV